MTLTEGKTGSSRFRGGSCLLTCEVLAFVQLLQSLADVTRYLMVLSSRSGVCSLSCWHPHGLSHRLWLQKLALGGRLFFSLAYCTGFGWDGVFLSSSSYGAVQICDPNGGGVAAVVWLLLSSAYAVSLHARAPWLFVTLPLPLSRLVGAQLGALS